MSILFQLMRVAKTATSGNRDVVYIVSNPLSIPAGDNAIGTYLNNNGYNVTYFDSNTVTTDDAEQRELVIIGTDVGASDINGMFSAYDIPVISFLANETNDHKMSTNAANSSASYVFINVTNNSHQITSYLSTGALAVSSLSKKFQFCYNVGSGAVTLATINGVPSARALVTYDTGSLLIDGSPAPNRRVMCWVNSDNANFLTAEGKQLILSCCEWALGFE